MEPELRKWHTDKRVALAIKNLKKNCFAATYVDHPRDAVDLIMKMIPAGSTIALGDSLTFREIGGLRALEERGDPFLNPWEKGITREESLALRRRAFTTDFFLTGTNALTLDGKLVSVDGLGNRVAAMIFGPKKVVVVVGVNKIVKDLDEAFKRIKTVAAPLNARRHNYPEALRPPCGDSGFCSDCVPPHRSCCNTVIIEGCSRDKERITVIIIGEDLGY